MQPLIGIHQCPPQGLIGSVQTGGRWCLKYFHNNLETTLEKSTVLTKNTAWVVKLLKKRKIFCLMMKRKL